MTIYRFLFLVGACWIVTACKDPIITRIKNEKGNYSILVLHNWKYEMKNRSTMISREIENDSVIIYPGIIVSPGTTTKSIEETFEDYKNDLPSLLQDYKFINEGITEIDGHATRWIKLRHTLYDYTYVSVRYFLQLSKDTPVMIECSSVEGTFESVEEDFTKMVFSFKVEE